VKFGGMLAMVGGTAIGVLIGVFAVQQYGEYHREDLFSPRPHRRLAALAFLTRNAGVETVALLRDYLVWERHALLRRRATALLKRLEMRYA
jgi:hypothetical protein